MKSDTRSSGETIDLSDLNLENHVKKAFRIAKALAGDQPIDSRRALQAAVLISGSARSNAFSSLATLLPLKELQKPPIELMPPADDMVFVLSEPLAKAFSKARGFFNKEISVWGRDFITMALLAYDDPSLQTLAQEVGSTVASLQDKWFEFVSLDSDYRDPKTWRDWWHSTGVPPPDERRSDLKQKIRSEKKSTYLLTWNPKRFAWSKIKTKAEQLQSSDTVIYPWSTGSRKNVLIGERVFLMRQGMEPKGLVGSGSIAGMVKEEPHWDDEEKKGGKTALQVDVRWDALSETPILPLNDLIEATGEEKLWRTRAGGRSIPHELSERLEKIWAKTVQPRPTSDLSTSIDIAGVHSDSVSADAVDHLDVEREAQAFARVTASSKTIPPLSIGVFGEWGSGKTFFMEKMQAHVKSLEKIAREASREQEPTAYHTNIVQILFNAWHYMESNLWASLVDHIFQELNKWLRPQQKSEEIEALFERLSTSRMLKLEAVENLIESRRREKMTKESLAQARKELAKTESANGSVTIGEFWAAVKDTFGESADDILSEPEKQKIAEAANALGFTSVKDSAKELMDALFRAREQGQRGRLIVRSVASRLGNFWWAAALIALLILVPVLSAALVELLESAQNLSFAKPLLEKISSTALALTSAAATATSWIGTATGFAARAINRLSNFQSALDKKLSEREKETPDPILQAEQLLAMRRKEVEIAEDSLKRATELVDLASFEFGDSARSRLNRFIQDKITNGEYAKHLGIIATIRKDFEQLAMIMSDVNIEQEKRSAAREEYESHGREYEAKIKTLIKEGFLKEEEIEAIKKHDQPSDEQLKFFQRIVLYIDDLDRCPPEKVVEVLQACHLLLSFPLFIVVVAVDARWVSRSLLARYEKLLEEDDIDQDGSEAKGHVDATASPRDYLEKIFQIPYWVRRMHGEASKNFAKELIGPVLEEAGQKPKSVSPDEQDRQSGTDPESPGGLDGKPVKKSEPDPSGKSDDAGEEEPTAGIPTGNKDKEQKSDAQQNDKEKMDPNPQSLVLTKHEKDFLAELAPYAGQSPRTIKRFVNVYRLLRTGLSEETLLGLVGDKGESRAYRSILGQLAIVMGAPTLADTYFNILEGTDGKSPATIESLLQKLGKTTHSKTKAKKAVTIKESPERASLSAVLNLLKAIDNSSAMIAEMQKHANVVKRYSFSARPYL